MLKFRAKVFWVHFVSKNAKKVGPEFLDPPNPLFWTKYSKICIFQKFSKKSEKNHKRYSCWGCYEKFFFLIFEIFWGPFWVKFRFLKVAKKKSKKFMETILAGAVIKKLYFYFFDFLGDFLGQISNLQKKF